MSKFIAEYQQLLLEAQQASQAVDSFDLDTEHVDNAAKWVKLCREEANAHMKLITFVNLNKNPLKGFYGERVKGV